MAKHLQVYTDGASRGNPGPAAAAYVLINPATKAAKGKGFFLGQTTNNVAEYTGLLRGLQAARKTGAQTVQVFSDSELMVRQINGIYKVKSQNLKQLYAQCMELLSEFDSWQAEHIYREHNTRADSLANQAMDMKADVAMNDENKIDRGKPKRLGVLISGGGRTMLNIQDEINKGNLNAEIAVVISSRATVKGVDRAKEMGLPLEIIRRKDFADIEEFSNSIYHVLKKAQVDLVIQAGWLCLWHIPAEYENRVMNIHPALLPAFGGTGMWGHHVHEAVLAAGCKISGCTVHFCTNEYDEGPIITQRCCPVRDDDDADSLAARVFEQECIAYPEAIHLFCQDKLNVENGIVKIMQ